MLAGVGQFPRWQEWEGTRNYTMPLYEFRCSACGERFERLVRLGEAAGTIVCPACEQETAERQFSTFARSGSARGATCDPVPAGGG